MKPLNSHASNEFHVWQRDRLPGTVVDVDAWTLALGDPHVTALVELKRSSMPVEDWRPFAADRPSYALLLDLARRAGVPLFVVYFRRGVAITDSTRLAVFRLEATWPAYRFKREVLFAAELRRRYPAFVV